MPNTAPIHNQKERKTNWGKWQKRKGNRHKRGYGAAWEKARAQALLRDNWLCQPCIKMGRLTEAQAVDHILPKSEGGTDDLCNLQSICNKCHNKKTASKA